MKDQISSNQAVQLVSTHIVDWQLNTKLRESVTDLIILSKTVEIAEDEIVDRIIKTLESAGLSRIYGGKDGKRKADGDFLNLLDALYEEITKNQDELKANNQNIEIDLDRETHVTISTKTGKNIYRFLLNEFRNQPKRRSQCFGSISYANIEKVSPGSYVTTGSSDLPDVKTDLNSLFYVQGTYAKSFVAKHPELFRITNNDVFGSTQFYCNSRLVEQLQNA